MPPPFFEGLTQFLPHILSILLIFIPFLALFYRLFCLFFGSKTFSNVLFEP